MGFLRFLSDVLSSIPDTITKGSIYLKKNGDLFIDIKDKRIQINPRPDWSETDSTKLSFIQNKPTIGNAASRGVITEVAQSNDIPTGSAVYNAIREIDAKVEATKSLVGSPLVAEGRADMTQTDHYYIYIGNENDMETNAWYYYDGSDWVVVRITGTSQITATDKTLEVSNSPADAKIVGDRLNALEDALATKDVNYTFEVNEEGHLIQKAVREDIDDNVTFKLEEGRLIVTYG